MYVVGISCLHSTLHLKTYVEGACELNFLLQYLYRYRENASRYGSKDI